MLLDETLKKKSPHVRNLASQREILTKFIHAQKYALGFDGNKNHLGDHILPAEMTSSELLKWPIKKKTKDCEYVSSQFLVLLKCHP